MPDPQVFKRGSQQNITRLAKQEYTIKIKLETCLCGSGRVICESRVFVTTTKLLAKKLLSNVIFKHIMKTYNNEKKKKKQLSFTRLAIQLNKGNYKRTPFSYEKP